MLIIAQRINASRKYIAQAIASRNAVLIQNEAKAAGVPLDQLYIDPLVYPLATNPESALATLNAIEGIMKTFPGVHTTCGLTNVSHGLPNRKLVNRTFLVAAVARGLDFGDPGPHRQTPLRGTSGGAHRHGKGRLLHGLHRRLP